MKEEFISYVWKMRLFDLSNLKTETGDELHIISMGKENHQAGPDFFNAQIKINDIVWAGNVEIHLKASDWLQHGHQNDKAYDNVILHVVYEADIPINRPDGSPYPTLELRQRIAPQLYRNYLYLSSSRQRWIPCDKMFKPDLVDEFTVSAWLDRLLTERLERKTGQMLQCLQNNKSDWESTLYTYLARSFGGNVNGEPFEQLARSLPHRVIAKQRNQAMHTEALLFGQAGLLNNDFKGDYAKQLQNEYKFLQKKYVLIPIHTHVWKFSKMRPGNFPSVRLAQFAALLNKSDKLFTHILETKSAKACRAIFEVQASKYWDNHYRLDIPSTKRVKKTGSNFIDILLINAVAPLLFLYGSQRAQPKFQDKAFELLESLPPEKNGIIDKWKTLGVSAKNAYESQALLQLKNEYCNNIRCTQCAIGNKLLRS